MLKKNLHKIIFVAAALSLILIFRFPLWRITLGIPQYPKDISVHIWINKMINGSSKAMEIINVLNHNIGMKAIEPDSIPELKYFQWIAIIMIVAGIFAGILKNKKLRIAWLGILVILCLLALLDFYLWQYHYGHDLEPGAPIAVQGSNFQPPLIGKKIIVNFVVESWPMPGVIFPAISLTLGFIALYLERKHE
jgi:copper chaperone NosL